jgi:hypothetical protein
MSREVGAGSREPEGMPASGEDVRGTPRAERVARTGAGSRVAAPGS